MADSTGDFVFLQSVLTRRAAGRHAAESEPKSATMSLREKVEKEVGRSIYEGLSLTVAVLEGTADFVLELLTNFQLFVLLYGVGEAIIFTRHLLGNVGEVVAEFVTLFISAVMVIIDCISILFKIVSAIPFVSAYLPNIPLVDPTTVLTGTWREEIAHIDETCKNYVNWQEVTGFFLGQLTKNNVCVFLRYIEPVPWLFDFFYGALDWLTVDPRPAPDGGNCTPDGVEWFCAALGLGFVIINLLIPLLLVLLIIKAYKPVIVQVVTWSWTVVHFLFHVLFMKLLRGACHSVEDLRCHWEEFLLQRHLRSK